MKILINDVDRNAEFENLEDAKKYYMPDLEEFPECAEYAQEIEEVENLEELADALNKYTDIYSDGRNHRVKEV